MPLVDDIIVQIHAGNQAGAIELINTVDKDVLEDHSSDLLLIAAIDAIKKDNVAVVKSLLKKGLRSGFALDAAVLYGPVPMVQMFLDAGISPSKSSISLAHKVHREDIADIITKKRVETKYNFFSTDWW